MNIDLKELQSKLEIKYCRENTTMLDQFVNAISAKFSKDADVLAMINSVLALIIKLGETSLQSLVAGDVQMAAAKGKLLLTLANSNILSVRVTSTGWYWFSLNPKITLPKELKEWLKWNMKDIPSLVPLSVSKFGVQHQTYSTKLLNGFSIKHHREFINITAAKLTAKQKLTIDGRVFKYTTPSFDDSPQYLSEENRFELPEEVTQRKDEFIKSWTNFKEIISNFEGRGFYLSPQKDLRYRSYYSNGSEFNFQNNKFMRGALAQAHKLVVTSKGLENLAIQLASKFKFEKTLPQVKLEEGQKIIAHLSTLSMEANVPQADSTFKSEFDMAVMSYLPECEDQPQFVAAALCLKDYLQGKPSGYNGSLDAAQSGPQLISCSTGDIKGMVLTGVIDDGKNKLYDLYNFVGSQALRISESEAVKRKLRKIMFKPAMVPFGYGSDVSPAKYFKEYAGAFIEAYTNALKGAAWVRKELVSFWNKDVTEYSWQLPNLSIVVDKNVINREGAIDFNSSRQEFTYKDIGKLQGGELGTKRLFANMNHSVDGWVRDEVQLRCELPKAQLAECYTILANCSGLPDNIDTGHKLLQFQKYWNEAGIVSIDAINYVDSKSAHLVTPQFRTALMGCIDSCSENEFSVRAVHDEFYCHVNFMHEMKEVYRGILKDLYQSSLLVHLLKQITNVDYSHKIPEFNAGVLAAMDTGDSFLS